MRKLCLSLIAFSGLTANVYAAQNPGYIYTSYGEVVRTSYGTCLHTAYFDPNNGLAECGEGPKVKAPVKTSSSSKPVVVVETIRISDVDDILFNFNQTSLTNHGRQVIDNLFTKLNKNGDVTKITIDGYTDGIGRADYNFKLSDGRANNVKKEFIALGAPADIITASGYGMKDIAISRKCFAKFGGDKMDEINKVDNKLKEKRFKVKKLNKKLATEKRNLENKLIKLKSQQAQLKACTAPDRKVVFTIEHTKQENVVESSASAGSVSAAGN